MVAGLLLPVAVQLLEAEPDSSCCDIVLPQFPTPTTLSIVFESNIGFKHELSTAVLDS